MKIITMWRCQMNIEKLSVIGYEHLRTSDVFFWWLFKMNIEYWWNAYALFSFVYLFYNINHFRKLEAFYLKVHGLLSTCSLAIITVTATAISCACVIIYIFSRYFYIFNNPNKVCKLRVFLIYCKKNNAS